MKIRHLIQESFATTHPYAGIESIEKSLRDNSFLVVIENGTFLGILTPSDIIESPHHLVIDCLHDNPLVDLEQDIESVLILMKESRNPVLPVFDGDKFVGVITRSAITDYLSEYRNELNHAVSEHTVELTKINEHLRQEIEDSKRALEGLLTYQQQLRSLSSQLSVIEEHERHRIATELHEQIGQTLAYCKIKLAELHESIPYTVFANSLNKIQELIEQVIQSTRSLTYELSPPVLYDLGFEAAAESLAEKIQIQHNILVDFYNDAQPKPMSNELRILLYKALRELLINIVKHAQAQKAKVSINRDSNDIRIIVEDDGIGFDTSKIESHDKAIGFGLFNIRERLESIGGHVEFESKPGYGTRITIVAPLK